jgi:4-hydroxy-3-polyprenylbenzoate decarboxylase
MVVYRNLAECIEDLEKHGQLIRIREEVDPHLEMASIHLKMYEAGGPAILFEKVKGSRYPAVSNLFGTIERSEYMFRRTWKSVQQAIALRNQPVQALKKPWRQVGTALAAVKALPKRMSSRAVADTFDEIQINELPLIKNWPDDGGAFVTLPQVYSEDPEKPGVMNANLGMYRVQLNGNEYIQDKEIGIHYQIHRGIGVHQSKANQLGKPLKVSVFVGGPPSHTLSAVMPLPEGLSELTFAGMLAGRRFRYAYVDGHCVSMDADFVITGEIEPYETKPEGPFGDHLGYYSLTHPFPVLKIHKVYARKGAIWPFTVVGRPPQEDTSFGELIHALTGDAIRHEIPGVKEVHAVDAAGVHPLLFAIGSERYTPYQQTKRPSELLTLANRILGTGQLSLAKYLWITAEDKSTKLAEGLDSHQEEQFMQYVLERIDFRRDLHFQTETTIDTLDYSGTELNVGSKVIFAAYGEVRRELCTVVPKTLQTLQAISKAELVFPGVIALQAPPFQSYEQAAREVSELTAELIGQCSQEQLNSCPLFIICDDAPFVAATIANFLWVTFTRSNPSHDIYGINSFYRNKHWGCDQLLIDARIKPHHAPPLIPDQATEAKVLQRLEGWSERNE